MLDDALVLADRGRQVTAGSVLLSCLKSLVPPKRHAEHPADQA
jgi:hypothetical protein